MKEWEPTDYHHRRRTEKNDDGTEYDIFGEGDSGRRPCREGFVFNNFYGRYEHPDQNKAPAVRCGNCFGDKFRIKYGGYCCIAVCDCGYEQEVYDG